MVFQLNDFPPVFKKMPKILKTLIEHKNKFKKIVCENQRIMKKNKFFKLLFSNNISLNIFFIFHYFIFFFVFFN